MKLREYHNPENIDESLVPDGWRFRYADEMPQYLGRSCRLWLPCSQMWSDPGAEGTSIEYTYIVPVNS